MIRSAIAGALCAILLACGLSSQVQLRAFLKNPTAGRLEHLVTDAKVNPLGAVVAKSEFDAKRKELRPAVERINALRSKLADYRTEVALSIAAIGKADAYTPGTRVRAGVIVASDGYHFVPFSAIPRHELQDELDFELAALTGDVLMWATGAVGHPAPDILVISVTEGAGSPTWCEVVGCQQWWYLIDTFTCANGWSVQSTHESPGTCICDDAEDCQVAAVGGFCDVILKLTFSSPVWCLGSVQLGNTISHQLTAGCGTTAPPFKVVKHVRGGCNSALCTVEFGMDCGACDDLCTTWPH